MKTVFISMFLISLTILSAIKSNSFAQIPDTLVVSANPPGNLNNIINGDTTATGEQVNPDRVYVVKQTGVVDTIYFLTEEIRIKDLNLVGITNPNTGFPPVIQPYIHQDGTSINDFIVVLEEGVISLKNLYLLATRSDGLSVTSSAISAHGESVRFVIDECVFENFGAQGTSNILNTWNTTGSDIFVTNSLFRNNQSDIPHHPCGNWAGPGLISVDSVIYRNNTFFVLGGCIEGSNTDVGYLEFDHNTIFMTTKNPPFYLLEQSNSVIRNNIFFGVYSAGLDSLHMNSNPAWSTRYYFCNPAVIILDTLIELKHPPFNRTEDARKIVVENNAYFWPQTIADNFDTLNGNSKYQIVGGKIFAPVWAAATNPEMLTDRTTWPGIDISTNNDSIDPGFDPALVQAASDSMARFVRYVWENGSNGTGSRPFVYLSDPNNMFAGVPKNWAEIQGYPVHENLRYSNELLYHAGIDGKALGDLNWFPEQIVNIEENSKLLPQNFNLSQNYPNPFNPTTTINYSFAKSGFVTIKVFNLLGQEVVTLINKEQRAGEYSIEFNAANLASGIYLYRIQIGDFSMSKKMLYLK